MKIFVALAALLQLALCGHVAIRMPYLNPAGVTYINNIQDGALDYASPYQHIAEPGYVNPYQQVAAPLAYAASPAIPAKVEAHHVGYATAQVPGVAAVPYVKHVPTVSQVPITRIEAQPAVLEKQLDVVKPAVSTRKVEVRRPAIQKQFYDIEERVIIRPAGSAVVELDEPTSKQQKGPAVIQPLANALHFAHPVGIHQAQIGHLPVLGQSPIVQSTPSSFLNPSSTPIPPSLNPEEESVVVENADFRKLNQEQEQQRQQFYGAARFSQVNTQPQVLTRSNGVALDANYITHDPSPAIVPSQRYSAEENKSNQNKLIELLTARGGVAELGLNRDESSFTSVGETGHVRARVISATPAPDNAEPSGERVSTRRVVVSRPIETLQELDVVEPATKIERVSVQQPTFIKTARLDHVQVHGSVPVIGKALAPTVSHAAVPLYQKTISPAYEYYH